MESRAAFYLYFVNSTAEECLYGLDLQECAFMRQNNVIFFISTLEQIIVLNWRVRSLRSRPARWSVYMAFLIIEQ